MDEAVTELVMQVIRGLTITCENERAGDGEPRIRVSLYHGSEYIDSDYAWLSDD